MASFIKMWESRHWLMVDLVEFSREAYLASEREYQAAVRIQSWFRGCRVRAYLSHLNASAITIQRNYRGYLGRGEYRRRLKKCLDEMRNNFYHATATKIQCYWRGYYVRKYVFNYHTYRAYMNGLILTNEMVREQLKNEWEKAEMERAARDDQLHELQIQEQAQRHHYLLSTKANEGVFGSSKNAFNSFEERMRAARFAPPIRQRLRTRRAQVLKPSEETETKGPLPPLVRVQGPFKSPEKVWKQRNKPLNLSLTASTDYNSLEIARAELRAEEWRNRLIDEKFHYFYRKKYVYSPQLHPTGQYSPIPYGSIYFRATHPEQNISSTPFRIYLPRVHSFDKINSIY